MFGKSDLLTLETIVFGWDVILMGINAGAQVAIIFTHFNLYMDHVWSL